MSFFSILTQIQESLMEQEMVIAEEGSSGAVEDELEEDTQLSNSCSEETIERIRHIYLKMEQFTLQVSELLEAGKATFKSIITEFEERLIAIHREQIEKWDEEIRELRLLDMANEEARALLRKVRLHLAHNVQISL
ncbi:knotted 1-binding protein isoform X2 [Wolffia australiana]